MSENMGFANPEPWRSRPRWTVIDRRGATPTSCRTAADFQSCCLQSRCSWRAWPTTRQASVPDYSSWLN